MQKTTKKPTTKNCFKTSNLVRLYYRYYLVKKTCKFQNNITTFKKIDKFLFEILFLNSLNYRETYNNCDNNSLLHNKNSLKCKKSKEISNIRTKNFKRRHENFTDLVGSPHVCYALSDNLAMQPELHLQPTLQ